MHILVIPSWYPKNPDDIGGSFFREQSIALRKHGCKVGVIFPALRSLKNWQSIFLGEKSISIELDEGVVTLRSHGMNWFPRSVTLTSILFVWHGLKLYKQYVAEYGTPDIIQVHSLLHAGGLASEIYKRYKIPFVVTEHSAIYSKKRLSMAKKNAYNAAKKFAVSDEFAKLLNKEIIFFNIPWEVMYNIVNKNFYSHQLTLKNKDSSFKFINIALMNKNKSQGIIILALANILKNYPNVELTLVGDGPERPQLELLAHKLGISDKIEFTGLLSRKQVLPVLAEADTFVLSSQHETFGVVVIEALALGKPVISTRCGGPESFIRKQDGILIPVDDIDALAEAMVSMIKNKSQYNAVEIRQACIDRFSEKVIAERLIKIYESIVDSINYKYKTFYD